MKALTFKRGIHPHDAKESTNEEKVITIPAKAGWELVYPMVQHLGAPCEPIVSKGDKVLLGQKIAESKAFVSSPVHASVSGTIKDIRQTLTPTGITCNAIVLECDGENTEHESLGENANYNKMTKDEMLTLIKEAGIVGLGGAGFPTHIKLNPPPEKKIEFIIVNASECEPYLTTDHRVLLEDADKLIRGLRIMLKLHPGSKGVIGVETNKQNAIDKLINDTKDIPEIEIKSLVPKYPQGSEKQLIFACTGREVPSGGLPADVGCIVNNVDTVIAIDRAIVRGRPLMRKIVTFSGDAIAKPGNYKVRLGCSYKNILEEIGGFSKEPVKMVSGGPMMGVAMYTTDVPIVKTSSAFLAFSEKQAALPPEQNCIRCGKCVEHCPMGLMPLDLNAFILNNEESMFRKYNGLDCIECGSCSYVCPAKRHLAQSIRATRRDLMSKNRK